MARAISCNGATVLKLRLLAPIACAWVADLDAVSETAITGAVTVTDGVSPWKGTVLRSGVVAGVCSATIVGGKGGLRKELGSKSYVGGIARNIVNDILNESGETLARKAQTASELLQVLNHWTRIGTAPGAPVTAGEQLASVLEHVGATWRVLPDGTIWIGTPTFKAAKPTGLFEITREPARERVHVELDGLDLFPDTTVGTDRVGDVEYRVEDKGIRATYWLEAA